MTTEETLDRKESFAEIDAMASLQGFAPDKFSLDVREQLLAGKITHDEAIEMGKAHYKRNNSDQ